MVAEKACSECGHIKPLTEYYKHKGCADGHVGQCKSCINVKSNAYRKTPSGKASVRKHQQTQAYKDRRKAYRQTESGKLAFARGLEKFWANNPKRKKVHIDFNNALKLGKVKKYPCFVCGDEKSEGHHPDYDQPLSVIWLCRTHHLEIHHSMRGMK